MSQEQLLMAMNRGRLGIDGDGASVFLFDRLAEYNPGWFYFDWEELSPEHQVQALQVWEGMTPERQAFYLNCAREPMPLQEQDFTVEKVGNKIIIRMASWDGGYRIEVTPDPSGQGLRVVNQTDRSRCIYQHHTDRDTLLISDAQPKSTWKEFDPI